MEQEFTSPQMAWLDSLGGVSLLAVLIFAFAIGVAGGFWAHRCIDGARLQAAYDNGRRSGRLEQRVITETARVIEDIAREQRGGARR